MKLQDVTDADNQLYGQPAPTPTGFQPIQQQVEQKIVNGAVNPYQTAQQVYHHSSVPGFDPSVHTSGVDANGNRMVNPEGMKAIQNSFKLPDNSNLLGIGNRAQMPVTDTTPVAPVKGFFGRMFDSMKGGTVANAGQNSYIGQSLNSMQSGINNTVNSLIGQPTNRYNSEEDYYTQD